jgi:hypothetical protein
MSGRQQTKNETSLSRAINIRGFEVTPVCKKLRPFLSGEPALMTVYNRIQGKSTMNQEKVRELIEALNTVLECGEDNPIKLTDVTLVPETFRVS